MGGEEDALPAGLGVRLYQGAQVRRLVVALAVLRGRLEPRPPGEAVAERMVGGKILDSGLRPLVEALLAPLDKRRFSVSVFSFLMRLSLEE